MKRYLIILFLVLSQKLLAQTSILETYIQHRPDTAIFLGKKMLQGSPHPNQVAQIKLLIAKAYHQIGDSETALQLCLESSEFFRQNQDEKKLIDAYQLITLIYQTQRNTKKVTQTAEKLLDLAQKSKNMQAKANAYISFARVQIMEDNYAKAIVELQKALKIEQNLDSPKLYYTLNLIGRCYYRLAEYEKATQFYETALQAAQKNDNPDMQAAILDNLGDICVKTKDWQKAYQYYQKALQIAKKNNISIRILEAYQSWAEFYKQQANYQKQANYQDSFIEQKEMIYKLDKSIQSSRMETIYQVREKDKAIENLEKEQAYELKIRTYAFFTIFLLGFMALFLVVAWKKSQHKNLLLAQQNQKILEQNTEIITQNEELRQMQEELSVQRENLDQKNQDLTFSYLKIQQSIQAAQLIQQAILPTEQKMKELFEDYFVINMPKDIVSGDFWWAEQVDNHKIFALADCTGHGVAGALTTMLGVSFLDHIVRLKKTVVPQEILQHLDLLMREVLQQQHTGNTTGMDIAIVSWKEQELCFAGAKISLYVYQNSSLEIFEASRKSIGGKSNQKDFHQKHLQIKPQSTYYLFSDGLTDQNNAQRERYSKQRLKELIQHNATQRLAQQAQNISSEIQTYMKNTEQRDDILMVAFQIPTI